MLLSYDFPNLPGARKRHQPRASVARAWLAYKSRLNVISSPALRPVRSLAGDDDTSGSGDIDALARMLSQQAAKLRASIGDEELRKSYDGFDDVTRSGVFGLQSQQLEERVFREIGPGFFDSADFEVLQLLGRISVMRDIGGHTEGLTAVIAYAARFLPRLPMQRPLTVLLKEYLPVARAVAFNELLVLSKLCDLPQDQYVAANRPTTRHPPLVPLLGYFVSAPSEEAASVSLDSEADSVWLVYRWEGLRPLNMYLGDVRPPEGTPSFFKRKEVAEAEAWRARHSWLRAVSRALLGAVAHCHGAGVTHGSISSGTVFLSSTRDEDAESLFVKLDNFGFGRLDPGGPLGLATPQLPNLDIDSTSRNEGRKHDLQMEQSGPRALLQYLFLFCHCFLRQCLGLCMATALTLLEAYSAATATSPSGALARTSLTRLLFEIYWDDMAAFRQYCADDPPLSRLVAFLDEGDRGGWDFVAQLVRGNRGASELLLHPFLQLL
ncbi:hypothetical protein VOLCADRAFT_104683 [Volvox carteri f. nagariensis]|uniref:Protein kinase domain-containing protein n=1 Tax=Volvox carteri f. nagariensis TaxID=3068 RepID=D8TV22_VOLCA|nr:uncharacterized protein VOLCADRAFT_104683 [Volvox carteri f. nagariensis]EFJ48626.1 hypothetical protein VOLCADRAFT_104683 [Volvox carteri f. nagariensis]|eukprot:XP_002950425.1 hypothetical protein VOLCADRAFT_104683 [Volvox carteri f. nagariensis]